MPRTTQLRTYTVRDGLLDEWVERWREEIVSLRLELGFTIGGAWVDRERNAMYWASPARQAMNLAPDDYLLHTDDRTVEERY
jgi:hypothetical protein